MCSINGEYPLQWRSKGLSAPALEAKLHGIAKLKWGSPQLLLSLRRTELRRVKAIQRTLVANVDFLRRVQPSRIVSVPMGRGYRGSRRHSVCMWRVMCPALAVPVHGQHKRKPGSARWRLVFRSKQRLPSRVWLASCFWAQSRCCKAELAEEPCAF